MCALKLNYPNAIYAPFLNEPLSSTRMQKLFFRQTPSHTDLHTRLHTVLSDSDTRGPGFESSHW